MGAISPTMWSMTLSSNPRVILPRKSLYPVVFSNRSRPSSSLSTFYDHHNHQGSATGIHVSVRAASSSPAVGNEEYMEEPATNVKFQTSLSFPGCSSPLSLLGTGYREKVFAIIGVKVYAAGLYVNQSILNSLDAYKGQSADEFQKNSTLFKSIFEAPLEKSLQIVLVRDVDGKTFWGALDDAISPRIKAPNSVDQSALSTFRSIFQGRSLKKGTFIFLTWLDPSKMLVSVSSDGMPLDVEAMIESSNVTFALYDVFFGDASVSPSLKASIANGLASVLK